MENTYADNRSAHNNNSVFSFKDRGSDGTGIVTTQNKSGYHEEMSSIATQQIKSPIQLVDIVVLVMDLFDYVIEVANAYFTKTFIPIRLCLSTPPNVSTCTRGLSSTEQASHL